MEEIMTAPRADLGKKSRIYIILATLLALFIGALDTLVMSAAMPTIVSDLGGLHLYSWVFSAYLLSRAVSLPVFGKLADIFSNRALYGISIIIFILASVFAGLSENMIQLTLARVIQGIGAGGNFALAYIVLADISEPENRGKMMSFASFVWGVASVLGPTSGGFMVSFASWRWIFWINIPMGFISLGGIILFLKETRIKRKDVSIDFPGIIFLTITVLTLLIAFLLAGRDYSWTSPGILTLFLTALLSGIIFYHTEKRAKDPILSFSFFRTRGFSAGNGSVFLSSVAIFSLAAFSPLFIQGALGKSPTQLGIAMVYLSLGWSLGALCCGRMVKNTGEKAFAICGALMLSAGCAIATGFSPETKMSICSLVLGLAGFGMGCVSISTLLIVQNSVGVSNLGIATSSHQFTRTLGGTIGIGIAGSIVTAHFSKTATLFSGGGFKLPAKAAALIRRNFENIFRPEIQSLLPQDVLKSLQESMGQSVIMVFWLAFAASVLSFLICLFLPARHK